MLLAQIWNYRINYSYVQDCTCAFPTFAYTSMIFAKFVIENLKANKIMYVLYTNKFKFISQFVFIKMMYNSVYLLVR